MATSWDFRRGKKKWPGSFSALSCSSPCSERKQCGWCHLTYHYSSHLLITTPEGKWNLLFGMYDLLATRFNKYAYWSGRKVAYDPQGLRTCKGKIKKKGTLYKCRYVRKGMAKEFESCPPGGQHHSWKLSCGIWANRKRPCCFPQMYEQRVGGVPSGDKECESSAQVRRRKKHCRSLLHRIPFDWQQRSFTQGSRDGQHAKDTGSGRERAHMLARCFPAAK